MQHLCMCVLAPYSTAEFRVLSQLTLAVVCLMQMRLTFIESDLSIYSEIYYQFEYIDDVFEGTIAHSAMLYTVQWNFFVNSNFITSYH